MGSLLQDTTLMCFQGTNIQVEGTPYLLTRLVSEKVNVYDNERIGVFYAQRETDMLDAVIKMHIQRHPLNIPYPDEREGIARVAKRGFNEQVQALKDCSDTSPIRTPIVLGHECRAQGPNFEYKDGYLNLIAMTMLPGRCLLDYRDLSDVEIYHVKNKLIEICENLRIRGWEYAQAYSEDVLYDRETKAIYLVGFAHVVRDDPSRIKPINTKSLVIWEFGLNVWRF